MIKGIIFTILAVILMVVAGALISWKLMAASIVLAGIGLYFTLGNRR